MKQDRLNQFRTWLTEQALDAFLITQVQNRSYLSGWFNEDSQEPPAEAGGLCKQA